MKQEARDFSHVRFTGLMEEVVMSNFSINEMLSMQCELQEKYKNKLETIGPDAGKHKLYFA